MFSAEEILRATCRIGCVGRSGNKGIATALFYAYGSVDMLITIRHSIEGFDRIALQLNIKDIVSGRSRVEPVGFPLDGLVTYHPNDDIDLAAVNISHLNRRFVPAGREILRTNLYAGISDSLQHLPNCDSIEDIAVVGYPNGAWDPLHNYPIIRPGVSATPLNIPGIDFRVSCHAHPGNSGSGVFVLRTFYKRDPDEGLLVPVRRYIFGGVLHAAFFSDKYGEVIDIPIPRDQKQLAVFEEASGLAKCYNAREVLVLINTAHGTVQQPEISTGVRIA